VRWYLDAFEIAKTIVNELEEKKGEDIVLMDVQDIAPFADYFVICSGTSDRMLDALSDSVVRKIRDVYHVRPRIEGLPRDGWILADYGQVIVHIFSPSRRKYYQLEQLWREGKVLLHLQ